ncbi:enterochelin esterase [Planomonospora venezuelensis]|uniref:Enterochelin esterase family protein n=1 Tax=Planomonospora venezuelensis TaxID=1999 RepID=A0A841D3W8_PLAVE|nr:enterochelin esterase [Planomonospora venezuelensis]MBB5963194.1 enterochelin esterase family protein [Planomonospora venezuelensis]GIN00071.1 enterochelin esterase [Planomonospora venezuelensis]
MSPRFPLNGSPDGGEPHAPGGQPVTPLVETAGTAGRHRVTFLWRARSEDEQAVVLINTLTDRDRHAGDISGHVMHRTPGDDMLRLTYELDADLRASYQILPCAEIPGTDRDSWLRVMMTALPDPGNPVRIPGSHGRNPSSLLELPGAPAQPYRDRRPGVPEGRVHESGTAGRRVWVYTPPGHGASGDGPGRGAAGPYPVLVLLDGDVWAGRIAPTMDNLIAEGRIPPMAVLLPDAVDRPTRLREMACHEPFVRHLAGELLPWAVREWGVTDDPALTVVAGQSFGGLTASYAAFTAPERFGNVLSQSGSYWWSDEDPEWLTRRYERVPRLPVRFHVEAGRLEWMLLEENRRFAEMLAAKGYEVTFTEYNGGHDPACWLGGLAGGLTGLAAGWL